MKHQDQAIASSPRFPEGRAIPAEGRGLPKVLLMDSRMRLASPQVVNKS